MMTLDESDYLITHRAELLATLSTAHPIAVIRALASAISNSESAEDLAMWLHELLHAAPATGHEFTN